MARKRRLVGDPKLAVGYIRVSKEDQELGPDAQRDAIDRWCQREGIRLVAWHVEHLCSVTPVEKRKGLPAALADLVAHGAGVLIVARRDRIARDPILTAMIERLAADAGAVVKSASGEGTDSDDPTSILMRRILDAFAEYERLVIKMRTSAALAVKKRRGERTGGIPYGWRVAERFVLDPETQKERHLWLEPEPAERAVVERVRTLRARGLSQRAIVAEMELAGVVGRTGRPLKKTQVRRMLEQTRESA